MVAVVVVVLGCVLSTDDVGDDNDVIVGEGCGRSTVATNNPNNT